MMKMKTTNDFLEIDDLNFIIYDVETLRGLFTCYFKSFTTGREIVFEISEYKNDLSKFVNFINARRSQNYYFVGFNNLKFDGGILSFIFRNYNKFKKMETDKILKEIYEYAQELIYDDSPFVKYPQIFKQLDIFKQKHYDGKAKLGTSLKWLQFTMNFDNVEDMPIDHRKHKFTREEVDEVIKYNQNDVLSTFEFFKKNLYETELRLELSQHFSLNLLNSSEPDIVKSIFLKLLSEDMGIDKRELSKMKTYRSIVKVKDLLFDYLDVKHKGVWNFFNNLILHINELENQEHSYTFKLGNVMVTVGLGGIHACIEPGVYKASDTHIIEDLDVTSFYPMLAIKNNIKPEHLGESYIPRYLWFFTERKKYPKGTHLNYILKICLNTAYGLTNESNSILYDPQYTYTITSNGQLSLIMLTEKLLEIPNLIIYQINTDGITIGYDIKYKKQVQKIKEEFEQITQLSLEENYYKQMNILNVNHYSAVFENGNVVRKGSFGYLVPKELDYHRNPSFTIIPKAIDKYLIEGIPVEETIRQEKDPFLFLGAIKSKSTFKLNLYSLNNDSLDVNLQQKVCRHFISKKGGALMKDFLDGRKISCYVGSTVEPVNHLKDFDRARVDEAYYITKAKKIIYDLEKDITQLKLF